jgi:hypothetical protein
MTTTTTAPDITTLSPNLDELIKGVVLHSTKTEAIPAIMETLMPIAGRANLRAKAGTAKPKTAKAVKVVEPMVGDSQYLRPNGQAYFSRMWGEHSDIEVLRTARANKKFILLYGSPGCGKTALVEGAFGEELYTLLGTGDTEVSDFVGGYIQTPSGGFEWVDGVLTKAVAEGRLS